MNPSPNRERLKISTGWKSCLFQKCWQIFFKMGREAWFVTNTGCDGGQDGEVNFVVFPSVHCLFMSVWYLVRWNQVRFRCVWERGAGLGPDNRHWFSSIHLLCHEPIKTRAKMPLCRGQPGGSRCWRREGGRHTGRLWVGVGSGCWAPLAAVGNVSCLFLVQRSNCSLNIM